MGTNPRYLVVDDFPHEGRVVGPLGVEAPVAHEGAMHAGARNIHHPVLLHALGGGGKEGGD